ncbi:hypothetical protein AVEN_263279-1 [Araneus ventricosus]|uniref:Uncharacterized protein n=1 Tax=Araneus ventricosus TaxID=182803 RepID=A0A4Y2HHC5_ARAVE|nr:hypothetical protein AVEN_263279-1 [Araneus ventricosus]
MASWHSTPLKWRRGTPRHTNDVMALHTNGVVALHTNVVVTLHKWRHGTPHKWRRGTPHHTNDVVALHAVPFFLTIHIVCILKATTRLLPSKPLGGHLLENTSRPSLQATQAYPSHLHSLIGQHRFEIVWNEGNWEGLDIQSSPARHDKANQFPHSLSVLAWRGQICVACGGCE